MSIKSLQLFSTFLSPLSDSRDSKRESQLELFAFQTTRHQIHKLPYCVINRDATDTRTYTTTNWIIVEAIYGTIINNDYVRHRKFYKRRWQFGGEFHCRQRVHCWPPIQFPPSVDSCIKINDDMITFWNCMLDESFLLAVNLQFPDLWTLLPHEKIF